MFLIWAYHSTSDVQPGQFLKHSLPGVRPEVTFIPGMSVICNQFQSLQVAHTIRGTQQIVSEGP